MSSPAPGQSDGAWIDGAGLLLKAWMSFKDLVVGALWATAGLGCSCSHDDSNWSIRAQAMRPKVLTARSESRRSIAKLEIDELC